MNLIPRRLFLAKANLNLFHTEDDFSSVNCESTIIIVTKSDIVRGKNGQTLKEKFLSL